MLRPMHEMDGNWYPWSGTAQQAEGNSAPEYVRAWRHMWTIFHAVGATNVTWVWSGNHLSLPNTPENQIQNYWPGSKYVDWVGISGFNWGTSSPKEVWKGFDSIALARYQELLRYHKPVALTEMGAPETGGNKPLWIRQTFHAIFDRYPRLKMVVWYDKEDTAQRQWQIDSSSASLQAFRAAVADPRVLQADSALATARPNLGS
jgi:beta-mannanase